MVLVTTMILEEDGELLEDQCTLCGRLTPWVANYRCNDHLVSACIWCCSNIGKAGKVLWDQLRDSQAGPQ